MTARAMTNATNRFLRGASSWLTDDDLPAVASLKAMAKRLDAEMTPALLAQYGLTYRTLLKRKPVTTGTDDELGDLLNGLD